MPVAWSNLIHTLTPKTNPNSLEEEAIYPLTHLSFIQITGPDAGKFLQGQLSCDMTELSQSQSGIGSHNSPKGRMLSSFRISQNAADSYLLCVDHSITDQAKAALAKYIVFSKADINLRDNMVAIGLHGTQAFKNLQSLFDDVPTQDYQQLQTDGILITCTSSVFQSYEIYADASQAIQLWDKLALGLTIAKQEQRTLIQNQLGLAFVEIASYDTHIPQMFNYQATQAISFKKGCYTGQEIVARMQYLGKLKRHMYHFQADYSGQLSTGDPICIEGKTQAIGNIAAAVQVTDLSWDLLLVLTNEAVISSALLINDEALLNLQKIPLPYDVEGLIE